ncbi:folate-Biopterin Transporter (FBT) family [Achlya hypogyna]|uniref:Folate-Biopterin Transporter (FBT) family n=1 Tax=Achlya hypogyna TaxID=1202772 RepID=A0A1V9ZS04_ACHHY|nr:folate-Biopterin Transporter (FBT) family [Achlya hypogyna]
MNLSERLSYVSSPVAKDAEGAYEAAATPQIFDDGALREGPAPVYTSPEVLGLLAQYVAVGLLYGAMPNLLYPLFIGYFHLEGSQFNSAKVLIGLGWSLKAFVGILSDCVPLRGYRRKSWMLVGWTSCLISMLVLATMDMGAPYFRDPTVARVAIGNLTREQLATINPQAAVRGGVVVILCAWGTLSYVISDVPADALVVEIAQREPAAIRGRMQSLIYLTRTVSSCVSTALIGFCLNSPRFAGSYSWDMGVNTIFILLAIACAAMLPITYWFVIETPTPRVQIHKYVAQFWNLVQRRATWQIMLFSFFFNLLNAGVTSTAAPYVMYQWAGVENVNNQLTGIVGNIIFAGVLGFMGKWGTLWNWKIVIIVTTLSANIIDAIVQFCTIYNIVRNQWFYIGVPLAENLPYAMQFIVTTFVIVELAEVGNEGVVYGLLTTVSNLPAAFGPVVANVVYGSFDVSSEAIALDSHHTRNQVAATYVIYYATTVLACFCVVLLPSQKDALHELQASGGLFPRVGGAVLGFCCVVLIYSIVASLLSMFEATMCTVIAGGKGCYAS